MRFAPGPGPSLHSLLRRSRPFPFQRAHTDAHTPAIIYKSRSSLLLRTWRVTILTYYYYCRGVGKCYFSFRVIHVRRFNRVTQPVPSSRDRVEKFVQRVRTYVARLYNTISAGFRPLIGFARGTTIPSGMAAIGFRTYVFKRASARVIL